MRKHESFTCMCTDESKKSTCFWTEFDSLSELVEAGTPARMNRFGSRGVRMLQEANAGSMTDVFGQTFTTLDATNEALKSGRTQPKTLDLFNKLRSQIETDTAPSDIAARSSRRQRVWSDQDGEPDADRVMDHRENFMRDSRRGRPMRVIRLGINITRSSGNDEQGYVNAAAYCGAMADHLVKLGYPVQIVGFSIVYSDGCWTAHSWPLKAPGEPLDIERVLSMALPGLHRWHICNGLREPGMVLAPDRDTVNRFGADYVFGRQWSDGQQSDIWEGIRNAMDGLLGDV